MEVVREHVHLLCSCPPRDAIGDVVRILKSKNSRTLCRECPGLRRSRWTGELWEDGYFVHTVGGRMTSEVIERFFRSHRELEQGPPHPPRSRSSLRSGKRPTREHGQCGDFLRAEE